MAADSFFPPVANAPCRANRASMAVCSLDETGIVKRVVKAACAVRACVHIADKMRVDLSTLIAEPMNPPEIAGLSGKVNGMFEVSLRSPAWEP